MMCWIIVTFLIFNDIIYPWETQVIVELQNNNRTSLITITTTQNSTIREEHNSPYTILAFSQSLNARECYDSVANLHKALGIQEIFQLLPPERSNKSYRCTVCVIDGLKCDINKSFNAIMPRSHNAHTHKHRNVTAQKEESFVRNRHHLETLAAKAPKPRPDPSAGAEWTEGLSRGTGPIVGMDGWFLVLRENPCLVAQ